MIMRASLVVVAALGLVACASEPRYGPPAPVVRVTPRAPAPATPPREDTPQPQPEASTEAQVYAYQDPALASTPDSPPQTPAEPEPAPDATPDAAPPIAPLPQPETPSRTPVAAPAQIREPEPPRPSAPAPRAEPKPPSKSAPVLPPPEQSMAMGPIASAPAAPAAPVETPSLAPAADALVRQAELQRQSGDYAGAAASLERSLRIAPREAYLWNRLARVRLEQGQVTQAGNFAARSNDLAPSGSSIKQDNWRIIAESRRRTGDGAGASEAERRASGG